jgi:hypothetical protein
LPDMKQMEAGPGGFEYPGQERCQKAASVCPPMEVKTWQK